MKRYPLWFPVLVTVFVLLIAYFSKTGQLQEFMHPSPTIEQVRPLETATPWPTPNPEIIEIKEGDKFTFAKDKKTFTVTFHYEHWGARELFIDKGEFGTFIFQAIVGQTNVQKIAGDQVDGDYFSVDIITDQEIAFHPPVGYVVVNKEKLLAPQPYQDDSIVVYDEQLIMFTDGKNTFEVANNVKKDETIIPSVQVKGKIIGRGEFAHRNGNGRYVGTTIDNRQFMLVTFVGSSKVIFYPPIGFHEEIQ